MESRAIIERLQGIGYYCLNDGALAASNSGSLPRCGVQFGATAVEGATPIPWIQIKDAYSAVGGASAKAKWEYSIIIQDNYGSFGAIDPDVDHEIPN